MSSRLDRRMIRLNLIPPGDKQELRLLNLFFAIKNVVYLALIGIIALAIGLVAAMLFLQNYFIYLVNSSTLNISIGKFSSSEIRNFRQDLVRIQQIQAEYIPWSELLLRLNRQAERGITLTDLTLRRDGQADLTGVAQTRDDLLRFRETLIVSGLSRPFELPFAAKLQRDNVRFNLHLQVAPPQLTLQ